MTTAAAPSEERPYLCANLFRPITEVALSGPTDRPTDRPKVKALRQRLGSRERRRSSPAKLNKPDSEDPDTVNHLNWYMSTGFTRPYPGEKTVRPPSNFNKLAPTAKDLDDSNTFRR